MLLAPIVFHRVVRQLREGQGRTVELGVSVNGSGVGGHDHNSGLVGDRDQLIVNFLKIDIRHVY